MYSHEEAVEAYLEATQTSRHLAPKTNPTPDPDFTGFWKTAFSTIEEMDAMEVNL
jgi:hypothetical protein